MKTYAEKEGEKPINWNKVLSVPYNQMTAGRLITMANLSASWVTCACGNQCEIIPRSKDGVPGDFKLRSLGVNFMGQILMMKQWYAEKNEGIFEEFRSRAIEILHEIELRSAELIKEIQSNENP